MQRIRAGILFGGVSSEHEVSLMSARSILNAIPPEKYEAIQLGVGRDGRWWTGKNTLERFIEDSTDGLFPVVMLPYADQGRFYQVNGGAIELMGALDVIFPVLHGSFGEDGNLQGYLELLDIPYVGAGVAASAVCMEKGLFKDVMRANHLPVVDWIITSREEVERHPERVARAAEARFHYPIFTKPANLGSSIGVNRCTNQGELLVGLRDAAQYSTRIAVEQGVEAWEVEVSVLGNENDVQVSTPGEVRYEAEFYSYHAKYFDDQTRLVIPALLDDRTHTEIRRLAGLAYCAAGCQGMARIDFLVEKQSGKVYINEINTIPGFTHASMYPRLWLEDGIAYGAVIDRLVTLAFERHAERRKTRFRYSLQE